MDMDIDILFRTIEGIAGFISVLAVIVMGPVMIYRWLRRDKHMPKSLSLANIIGIAPVILAPLVFYGSFFIFDNPDNYVLALLLFFAMNSYSVILVLMMLLSIKVYRKTGSVPRALLPLIPSLVVYALIITFILY